MVCFNCKEEYDDRLNVCPKCGAAAAVPVIPEMNANRGSAPITRAAAVIPETPKQAVQASVIPQEASPGQPQGESVQPLTQKNKSSSVNPVLAVMLVIMTALAIVLFIDRGRLKAELDDMEKDSASHSSVSHKSGSNDSDSLQTEVDNANSYARIVFNAARDASEEMEMLGVPVGSGVICSSPYVGNSTGSLTNAEYVMYSIKNITERTKSGLEWIVIYNDGQVVAAYAAEGIDTKYIGSYPTAAEGKCAVTLEEGRDNADLDVGGTSISANSLYGKG